MMHHTPIYREILALDHRCRNVTQYWYIYPTMPPHLLAFCSFPSTITPRPHHCQISESYKLIKDDMSVYVIAATCCGFNEFMCYRNSGTNYIVIDKTYHLLIQIARYFLSPANFLFDWRWQFQKLNGGIYFPIVWKTCPTWKYNKCSYSQLQKRIFNIFYILGQTQIERWLL